MMQIFQLQNFEIALKHLFRYLKDFNNFKPYQTKYLNQNRYALILGSENYFFMFKREPFYSFGKIFDLSSQVGETINSEHLKICFKHNVKSIFITYEGGNTYELSPKEWVSYGFKRYILEEGKETYSVPIRDLRRVNLEQEKKFIRV